MMKPYKPQKEVAVSPVIGVMLMLVVTIIIAAIVSAFAGGLAGSEKKPSQLNIEATYSVKNGMSITHAGGDPIPLAEVEFMTTPSELFGPDAQKFAWIFNKTALNSTKGPIMNSSNGFYYTSALVPGETLTVNATNCDDYASDSDLAGTSQSNQFYTGGTVNQNAQVHWGGPSSDKVVYFRSYQFQNPDNIGKYFYLDIVDKTGSLITRSRVPVMA